MLIGELAKKANVSIDTIRYYERKNLIQPVSFRDSGYREFDKSSVETIYFVVRAKNLGFSLKEIRTILALKNDPDKTCGEVKALAEKKLADVTAKIKTLKIMKEDLSDLLSECVDTESSVDPPPIKESKLNSESAIHFGNFLGGFINGKEDIYSGADYRQAASG